MGEEENVGEGVPKVVAVKPGLLAILVGLILAAGFGTFSASRTMHAQVGIANVVLLAFAALFAAVVLSGILGATGVIKTATQQIGGAAAIFLVTFGSLVTAATKLQPSDRIDGVRVHVHVAGLRADEVARVSLSGGCSEKVTGPEGTVSMTIIATCGTKDALDFIVTVAGIGSVSKSVPRASLSEGMPVEIQWKRAALAISGTVTLNGRLVTDGRVELIGCSSAPVDIDANSGGFVLPIPEDCVIDTATQAYVLNFHAGTLDVRRPTKQLANNDFDLTSPTPPPPDVRPDEPRERCCRNGEGSLVHDFHTCTCVSPKTLKASVTKPDGFDAARCSELFTCQ